jgi:hypothetical protein
MEKILHSFKNDISNFYSIIKLYRRKILQRSVTFAHLIAILSLSFFGNEFSGRYVIFAVGTIAVILSTFFIKKIKKRLFRFFKFSLNRNFKDLKEGFILGLAGLGFILALNFWGVLEIKVIINKFNYLFFLYPFSVAGQQFLYTLQPRILYRNYPKWQIFLCSFILFGCMHVPFGLSTALLATFCIGIPTAWLVVYRNNIVAAYILHLCVGFFAFYTGLV